MKVYRLGNPKYINDLSGKGASITGGRWNEPGQFVLYTAETAALAILEVLSHISSIKTEVPYQLAEINIEGSVVDYTKISPELPLNWAGTDAGLLVTRSIGSEWLLSSISPILRVPSVHSPVESNFLINATHPELTIKIEKTHWYLYDKRLVRLA